MYLSLGNILQFLTAADLLLVSSLSTPVFCFCVHSALGSILRAWLDQCPEDFQETPDYPCLQRLIDYLHRALPGSEVLRRAEGLLEQLQSQSSVEDTDGNKPIIFKLKKKKFFNVLSSTTCLSKF